MSLRRILTCICLLFFAMDVLQPGSPGVRDPFAAPPTQFHVESEVSALPAFRSTEITECSIIKHLIPCPFIDLRESLSTMDYVVRAVTAQAVFLPPVFVPIPPRFGPVDEDHFAA